MIDALVAALEELGSATVEEIAAKLSFDLVRATQLVDEALDLGQISAALDRRGAYTLPRR